MRRSTRATKLLRFAFDLGTHSIGWAVLEDGLPIDCGVRIYDDSRDPQDRKPLGEQRRGPRSARRRRDRFLMRRRRLIQMLIGFDLLPSELETRKALADLDPYRLRAEALDRPLKAEEIGRVLIHLNQRRGFKSNRKADSRDDDDKGKIAPAAERLDASIRAAGARTLGEFLWQRHKGPDGMSSPRRRQAVRIRLEVEGRDALYEFYPTRSMLEAEFDAIMAAQRPHHPKLLTDDRIALIRNEIFFQRKLRAAERGKCTFIPAEKRLPKALPSVEARIIYEAVNNLRFGVDVAAKDKLTARQRDEVVVRLLQGSNVTSNQLRKITGAPADVQFRIAAGEVNGLKDYISDTARKLGASEAFGQAWHTLALEAKDAIVWKLIGDDDDEAVCTWLIAEHGLSPEAAATVVRTPFRSGTARLGPTANAAVLAELMAADVPAYDEAVKRAGAARGETWHHSDIDNPERREFLPYYAQVLERQVLPGTDAPNDDPLEAYYGRIANPTVHRALRQLRKVVNALIRKHGTPNEIVVEVARDLKLGEKQKEEHRKTNKLNRDANDARRAEIEARGITVTADAMLRLRLFDEQLRVAEGVARCPYSLRTIERDEVLSDRIEIDHILPFSRTLDDSASNKVICYRDANRDKRKRTPHEAFGDKPKWAEIESNARMLPANKRWRFAESAMDRFENEERDFAARQLNETRYISKLARAYLTVVAGKGNVYVTTGQLTAMLRRRWKLNAILKGDNQPDDEPARKVRDDHRHHAVDAIVIGAIDRPLLNEMSKRAGQFEGEGRDWRITDAAPEEPCRGYAEVATRLVRGIIVSRKPDHGKEGALHAETGYGIVRDKEEAVIIGDLVTRKPLIALSASEVDRIRNPVLRAEVQAAVAAFRNEDGKMHDKKGFEAALKAFSAERSKPGRMQGVRRVRVGKAQREFVTIRNNASGAPYKALIAGENHHIDIVQMRDGTWKGFGATRFEVNQPNFQPAWERQKLGGKLVMRLHKGDPFLIDIDGRQRVFVVNSIRASKPDIIASEHFEGGAFDDRKKAGEDPELILSMSKLQRLAARPIHIDILGRTIRKKSNVDI